MPSHDTATASMSDSSPAGAGTAHADRRLLIDGQLTTTDRTFPSVNPATGDVIGHAPDVGTDEAAAAIAAARRAFDTTNWSTDVALRVRCLEQLHQALLDHAEELRELTIAEVGAVVIAFDDDDDAVRIANNSIYGLAGAVFSGDQDRAVAVARRVRTGSFSINGGNYFSADAPFGGFKQSGVGREMGVAGLAEFLERKTFAVPAVPAAGVA